RICMFPTSPLWMVYAILTGSIPALIGEILTTTSLLSAIIRYDILKKPDRRRAGDGDNADNCGKDGEQTDGGV
ncbi:MAG: YgjV family protein, partial [Clostridia bacterium]|nr:YgjV family protein [Clostridia bacterium]